jgi:hypothetical protein
MIIYLIRIRIDNIIRKFVILFLALTKMNYIIILLILKILILNYSNYFKK